MRWRLALVFDVEADDSDTAAAAADHLATSCLPDEFDPTFQEALLHDGEAAVTGPLGPVEE